ncbi:hypothetical protein C7974DRAFT_441445 [Boeremia exigua]|uniref:uncharacterized protein n=1 Tax=Boeremia exigua TaxID=749465 RepID=UPI001E8D5BF9|nr:uncharacterized protein C7974DRAFT_441445 [Boeremia exigua]KAH6618858.1 hypothetical protein C7974DRAFT_441445 [Boeremia exigua]
MAHHKRGVSKDITSNAHPTPLPTYYSQQLPRWTSKSAFEDQKAFEEKPEPFYPSYQQYPAPMPRFDNIPLPPRPQRRRWPKKAILIPWIIAAVFFLIALWFTSIALGVRMFIVMQPESASPPVQEIRVLITEDMFRGSASAYTSVVTVSVNAARATAIVSAPTSTNDGTTEPTSTGTLDRAPMPNSDPLEDFTATAPAPRDLKSSPTGFVTVVRTV